MSAGRRSAKHGRVIAATLVTALLGTFGCETQQVLTSSTAEPGFVPGASGAAGQAGSGSGEGGSSAVAVGGANTGPAPVGALGGSGGARPEPAGSALAARLVGCENPADPNEPADLVACGLSPHVDVVAADDGGIVFSRRAANGLVRMDRLTGTLTTLDTHVLGLDNGGRDHHPLREGELFAVPGAAGPVEAIDLRTGAHRLVADHALGTALALGASSLFYQAGDTGFLTEAPLTGDVPSGSQVLGKLTLTPGSVDGADVFAQAGYDLYRVTVGAGASELVRDLSPLPGQITSGSTRPAVWTVADGWLYWVENGGFYGTHRVLGRALSGGAERVYAALQDQECDCAPTGLRVANGYLTYVFYGNVHASVVEHPEIASVSLFTGYLGASTYAIHGGRVYAAAARGGYDAPQEGIVRRAALPALPPD